jgi:hypothetical protein
MLSDSPLLASPGRQAPQQGLDAGEQDARLNRFGNVVVGAHLEAENLVEILVAGGQHQDHAAILRAHGAADLETILAGQHDIEDDQVGLFGQDTGFGTSPRGSMETTRSFLVRYSAVSSASRSSSSTRRMRVFIRQS